MKDKYKHGIRKSVINVANTNPSPSDIAIGAKNAASPLVSNINVNSPAKVVSVGAADNPLASSGIAARRGAPPGPGALPPPHPDCVELTANQGCEASRTVLCKEPEIRACPFIYAPVCGVDGRTYSNECVAGDVEIEHEGECFRACEAVWQPVCGVDGRTYGNECEAGDVEIAHEGECEIDCPGIWDPVCGVDGQTYSSDCYAGTTEIAHYGECDQTQVGSCIEEGWLDARSHVRTNVDYEGTVAGHFEDGTEMYLPVEANTIVDVTIQAGFWFPVAQPQRTPNRIAERMIEVIEVKLEAAQQGETEMLMRDDTVSRSYSERISANRSYLIGQTIEAPIKATVSIRIDGHAVCTLENTLEGATN